MQLPKGHATCRGWPPKRSELLAIVEHSSKDNLCVGDCDCDTPALRELQSMQLSKGHATCRGWPPKRSELLAIVELSSKESSASHR